MHKKTSMGLLVVLSLLAMLVLVACGDATNTPGSASGSTPAGATTAAATTAAGSTTAAMTSAAAGATTAAATGTGKKIKVGLVTDIGRIDDKSFNQSAWEGVQQAGSQLGADVKYIETKNTADYAKNIKQFVDDKYDVIVTVGFLMGDATIEAAKANPTIMFIGVDQFQATGKEVKNLAGLVFDEDKSGFLAGVLAAGMSQKGKIASVLGTKSVPAVAKFGEGYKAGAAWLDANQKALSRTVQRPSTWFITRTAIRPSLTPTWGSQQAQTLIQSGFDVIFGAGGGTGNGAVEGAAQQGVYVIGVDTDQYLTLPKAAPKLLSSATKQVKDGVFGLIKDAQGGSLKGGNNIGPVGLAPFHDQDATIPQPLKDVLKKVDAGLKDGTIKTGVSIG